MGLWGKGILPPCKPNNGWTGKGQTGMLRSLTEVCLCTCTLAHFTLAQVIIVPGRHLFHGSVALYFKYDIIYLVLDETCKPSPPLPELSEIQSRAGSVVPVAVCITVESTGASIAPSVQCHSRHSFRFCQNTLLKSGQNIAKSAQNAAKFP